MPMRRTDVKLTRLRIGHTRFTHRHLLLGEDAPECPSCNPIDRTGSLCFPVYGEAWAKGARNRTPDSTSLFGTGRRTTANMWGRLKNNSLTFRNSKNCPLTASPHKSLTSPKWVSSLNLTKYALPEAEILEGFSGKGVIQVRESPYKDAEIVLWSRNVIIVPSPIPRSQNYAQTKPKWKIEKQIQEIKSNNNISYHQEARKLWQSRSYPAKTYAQVDKSSTATSTTQTDEKYYSNEMPAFAITSTPYPFRSQIIPFTSVSTSSFTTQANILPSASSIKPTTEIESRLPEPITSSLLLLPLTRA
ncbi:hypothetical protein TNCV_4064301 [Trichonephila clavipes]|nr:hypothetical protein TNCV_4064301 [Trichonephila clavipes]